MGIPHSERKKKSWCKNTVRCCWSISHQWDPQLQLFLADLWRNGSLSCFGVRVWASTLLEMMENKGKTARTITLFRPAAFLLAHVSPACPSSAQHSPESLVKIQHDPRATGELSVKVLACSWSHICSLVLMKWTMPDKGCGCSANWWLEFVTSFFFFNLDLSRTDSGTSQGRKTSVSLGEECKFLIGCWKSWYLHHEEKFPII